MSRQGQFVSTASGPDADQERLQNFFSGLADSRRSAVRDLAEQVALYAVIGYGTQAYGKYRQAKKASRRP